MIKTAGLRGMGSNEVDMIGFEKRGHASADQCLTPNSLNRSKNDLSYVATGKKEYKFKS